jgi:hypothetical protein
VGGHLQGAEWVGFTKPWKHYPTLIPFLGHLKSRRDDVCRVIRVLMRRKKEEEKKEI